MATTAARIARRLARAEAASGLRGVAAETLYLARHAAAIPVFAVIGTVFDWRRGVRTRGQVRHESALAPLSVGGDPVRYDPVDVLPWRRVHSNIAIERGETTFVDLGAGRGRAVILAAEMGFGRVIGVELDRHLAEEARENVRRWRSRRGTTALPGQDIVIVHGDAATYRLPDGPMVLWLFNPFGATTLRHVVRQLCDGERARSGDVYVAYVNPVHTAVLEEFPQLTLHSARRGWAVYRLVPDAARGDRPHWTSSGGSPAHR